MPDWVYQTIRYLRVIELTHWTKEQIDSHETRFVDDLLTANYWDKRIALKPRSESTQARAPITDSDVEALRASNPQLAQVPAAALKKRYSRRR